MIFPNYELFTDVNAAYSDFINKLMSVINEIAPFQEVRVKNRTEEWFDGEVSESIKVKDKLFKKFKKSKLQIDRDTCLSYLNDKILKGFDQGKIRGMILIDLPRLLTL